MKFTKEFLQDMDGSTVSDTIVDHRRWAVRYCRIFAFDGKYYRTYYDVGATEAQDEQPYQYEEDLIEVEEVFPVERTVVTYLSKEELER